MSSVVIQPGPVEQGRDRIDNGEAEFTFKKGSILQCDDHIGVGKGYGRESWCVCF
jgi:hypothetical protein